MIPECAVRDYSVASLMDVLAGVEPMKSHSKSNYILKEVHGLFHVNNSAFDVSEKNWFIKSKKYWFINYHTDFLHMVLKAIKGWLYIDYITGI